MKNKIFKAAGNSFLILSVFFFIEYLNASRADEDEWALALLVTVILSIVSHYLAYRNKNKEVKSTQVSVSKNDINDRPNIGSSKINTESASPKICPHCKSPNAKRLDVCEYCGNPVT